MKSNDYIDDKFTIDELLKDSWQFRKSVEFKKFFDFITRFDHYSRYNTMLVYIQNPEVTFFGGVSFWKKRFNRTIKKDAQPYIILAPRGPVMLVYDVFDTDGYKSPKDFLEEGLGRKPFDVKGELSQNIYDNAIEEAMKWSFQLVYKELSYFKGGHITTIFADRREICLKKGFAKEENFRVLIHELAHLFLGHTGHKVLQYKGKDKQTTIKQRKLETTTEELEAETISYLICKKLGLTNNSADYIAEYIKSKEDLLQFNYEMVIKTADKIESFFVKYKKTIKENKSPNNHEFI